MDKETSVLSIQSWVSHGYVGNKCSVFALQSLTIEVDPINTVQFSNHTAYPKWRGEVLQGGQLLDLYDGLEVNKLANYTHLLTGYVSSVSALRAVMSIREKLKKRNPSLTYVCDPVLGDDGRLYVSQDLVNVYREEVIQHADYLLPNETELEHLSGITVKDIPQAHAAMDVLHGFGVPHIILKSSSMEYPDTLLLLTSSHMGTGPPERHALRIPRLASTFTGTGDLFAALFLAWTSKGYSVAEACERTTSSLHCVLKRTILSPLPSDSVIQLKELKLLQSRDDIVNPPQLFNTTRL